MVRKVSALFVLLALSAAAVRADEKSPSSQVKIRFLSLAEARAIALAQGNAGEPYLVIPGIGLDCLVSSQPVPKPRHQYQLLSYAAVDDPERMILVCPESASARLDFERNVNQLLLNVETAYWNLYGSYGNLSSRVQAQHHSYEAWHVVKAQLDAGSKNAAEVAQARGQYELFRAQRLAALDTVLDNERQLRALLGIQVDDGCRIVPCDVPSEQRAEPDWKSALEEALKTRPEVKLARTDLAMAQVKCVLVKACCDLAVLCGCPCKKNKIIPTGRTWIMPFYEEVPKWMVLEALHRGSKLQLERIFAVLQDQELKAERFLGLQYRRIHSYYAQIQAQRAQRIAYSEQMKTRREELLAGGKTLDILLESQRFYADALANEYAAVTSYNNALCGFAFAKGAILDHAHVVLTNKAPEGATADAVKREQQHTRARVSQSDFTGFPFLEDGHYRRNAVRRLLSTDSEVLPELPASTKTE